MRTIGISRKLLAPVVAALTVCVTTWIQSGHFDKPQLVTLAVAVIGFAFGYFLPADKVDPGGDVVQVGPPSDALLAAQIDAQGERRHDE